MQGRAISFCGLFALADQWSGHCLTFLIGDFVYSRNMAGSKSTSGSSSTFE